MRDYLLLMTGVAPQSPLQHNKNILQGNVTNIERTYVLCHVPTFGMSSRFWNIWQRFIWVSRKIGAIL